MYSNNLPNCYCYSDFCRCQEFCNISTSNCCSSYGCCCPICRQRNKPKSTKMPAKPKPTNKTAAAGKNASNSKSKTIKAKRVSRNDNQKDQKIYRESVSSQENKALKTDQPFYNHHSLHSSSTSLRKSSSFNNSQSSGARLERINSKQKLNLNIAIPNTPGEKYSFDSTEISNSRRSTGSNQSRREQLKKLERTEQLYSQNSSNVKKQPHSYSKIQPSRICNCCNKNIPKYSGSPNTSRHSFSATKSCSQLDVIDEEDSDIEKNRRQCNSLEDFADFDCYCNGKAGTEKNKRSSSYNESKGQRVSNVQKSKSLEDSCADFLNIVCDNIMESVQESVDCKLKEFVNQTTEKFNCLGQKLEENETAMKNFIQEMAEKMTEQSKRNFEDFYSRVQELVEKQNEMIRNETQDEKPQFSETEKNEDNVSNITEHFSENAEEACDNNENFVKCANCHCYFEVDNFWHPCCPQEPRNETPTHSNDQLREKGGCIECGGTPNAAAKEVKPWESCAETYQKTKSLNYSLTSQEFCSLQSSSLPRTLTNFCLTPSGKITLKCNASTHSHGSGSAKMKPCSAADPNITKEKRKSNPKFDSSIGTDSYETSGYATEPEDNSEDTVVSSGRKKKKSFRQHSLNRFNSAGKSLDVFNNVINIKDDVSEKSSTQAIRRLSRSSLRSGVSSPTRLSRL